MSQPIRLRSTTPHFQALGPPQFTLYLGDGLDLLRRVPSQSIDLIFADPPYRLSNDGFSVQAGRRTSVNKGSWDRSGGVANDFRFHRRWLRACRRLLKPTGSLWVSGTYHSIHQTGFALQGLGYHILNDISWYKPNASPNIGCRCFAAAHESLIWAKPATGGHHYFDYQAMKCGDFPKDQLKSPGKQMRSVWSISTPTPAEKTFGKHPTQKPLQLLERIILASSPGGGDSP